MTRTRLTSTHARMATALTLALTAWAASAQTPIKIGFMAELSGPQAALGQDQYDAFMMVVERNGGKLGGAPVQIIREDSQLKPDVATQLVQKLIEKDNVAIITGITFSNVMMAVHKPITEKGIFLIGSNAGPAPIALTRRALRSRQSSRLGPAALSSGRLMKRPFISAVWTPAVSSSWRAIWSPAPNAKCSGNRRPDR